jgi:hypothetical protein
MRVKLALRKPRLDNAVARIRNGNESFVKLTDQVVALAVVSSTKKARVPNFQRSRQEARLIFATLDAGLQCHCKPDHVVCLGLLSARNNVQVKDSTPAFEHFRVALAVRSSTGPVSEIEYIADIEMQIPSAGSTAESQPNSGTQGPPITRTTPVQITTCNCLGFLASNDMVTSSASIVPSVAGPRSSRHIIVPVQTLLPVAAGQKGRLRARGRRKIALMASWNLLQLYSTPWLQDHIYWNMIGLIRSDDGSVIDLPFISKDLVPRVGTSRQTLSSDPVSLACIRNEWVYALGVFLIELCLGESISQLREPGDEIPGGMMPFLTEFRTATRLIEVVEDRAGIRYGAAVRRCIRCDFDQRVYDLDDDGFCQAFYKGVVTCLEDDVKQIDGDDIDIQGGKSMCF